MNKLTLSNNRSNSRNSLILQQSLTKVALDEPVVCDDDIDNKYGAENYSQSPLSQSPSDTSYSDIEDLYENPESDEVILGKHGYRKIKKIVDCLQGEVFYGETITDLGMNRKSEKVAIKKICRKLHHERITIKDDMQMVTGENVIKEAIILKYLTVNNKFTEYIQQYVDFFHSSTHFYLITKYIDGGMSLVKFVKMAHKYISEKRLSIVSYQKVTKFLFWQIVVMVEWLHNAMNICHLDLLMDNIMIKNGTFIENKEDNSVTIDPKISVRICDFGMAEGFKSQNVPHQYKQFECAKHEISEYVTLKAPQVFDEDIYDARKADVWSLGILLYQMTFSFAPYNFQNQYDVGFESLVNNKMGSLLQKHDLLKYVRPSVLDLISNCLQIDESNRYDTTKLMKHYSLSSYYSKYEKRIKQEKLCQQKKQQSQNMDLFPWYDELNFS